MLGRPLNSRLLAVLLWSCSGFVAGGEPGGTDADAVKLVLPDVTGLAGRNAAAPESIDGDGRQVARITVEVDKNGKGKLGAEDTVKPWRGTNLPKDGGPSVSAPIGLAGDPPEAEETKEYVIRLTVVDGKPKIEADGKAVDDFKALAKAMTEAKPKPGVATIDSAADVPFGAVAKVLAVVVEAKLPAQFRAPEVLEGNHADKTLRKRLASVAVKHSDEHGLSKLGVLVRADERAPWSSVREVTIAAMMAKTWRLAFAASVDGKEVVIGNVEGKGPKHPRPVIRHERIDPAP